VPAEFPIGAPWSDEDVERLLRLIESGCSMAELSRALGRSEVALEQEARFLGVLLPRHGAVHVSTRTADSSSASSTA
jgi:hypothetical protein